MLNSLLRSYVCTRTRNRRSRRWSDRWKLEKNDGCPLLGTVDSSMDKAVWSSSSWFRMQVLRKLPRAGGESSTGLDKAKTTVMSLRRWWRARLKSYQNGSRVVVN